MKDANEWNGHSVAQILDLLLLELELKSEKHDSLGRYLKMRRIFETFDCIDIQRPYVRASQNHFIDILQLLNS
jgi:hypothetical protein